MIHVGAIGGVFDFVPTSSSIMNRTYSQFSRLALGLPSVKRSTINAPVFTYHASPSLILALLGRNDGKVALGTPSP